MSVGVHLPTKVSSPQEKSFFISHDKNAGALQSWYDCGSLDGILPFPGNKFIFCGHVNARRALAAICFGILMSYYLICFESKCDLVQISAKQKNTTT
jgi:hypothetical protein